MSKDDDLAFLRYFFRPYIPPFTMPIPETEKEYEKVYLSSGEIWLHLYQIFDRISLPNDIKKNMVELFSISDEVWIIYLSTIHKEPYKRVMMKDVVREKWKKIQRLANNIQNYVKTAPELKEKAPLISLSLKV